MGRQVLFLGEMHADAWLTDLPREPPENLVQARLGRRRPLSRSCEVSKGSNKARRYRPAGAPGRCRAGGPNAMRTKLRDLHSRAGRGWRAARSCFHAHRVRSWGDDVATRTCPQSDPRLPGDMPSFRLRIALVKERWTAATRTRGARGPWPGQVVAAVAVIDSTAAQRTLLKADRRFQEAGARGREAAYEGDGGLGWAVRGGRRPRSKEIDRINILQRRSWPCARARGARAPADVVA